MEVEEDLTRPEVLREHYVPMHSSDLVRYLSAHPALPKDSQATFAQFAGLTLSLTHHIYRQRYEQLTGLYAPLDPDSDRVLLEVPLDEKRQASCSRLAAEIRAAVARANYHRLSEDDIQRALKAASQWGVRMRVNFQVMERMEVYARGFVIGSREHRNWKTFFRRRTVEVPLYQRLMVVFHTRPEDENPQFDYRKVYLRLFKNVPKQDIDMMLPATGIQMSWIDHSRIVVPSIYAAAMTMWRFLRNVLLWTFFGVFKTLGLVVLVVFALGFGIKSMFTYRTATKRRYMLNMTQKLYYQNLDNNSGVLLRLLDDGEQQEAAEVILCYFAAAFLLPQGASGTLAEIDSACELLLESATGIQVDFDVEATARNMVKLGLLKVHGNSWQAVPLDQAMQYLDTTWDSWFRLGKGRN
ncbi:MAG TPA: hypothetical protein DDW52_08715 [Planctomycetaceae bacterium]|nr:hypothetical protein [Planctomycetaceae bacterium]